MRVPLGGRRVRGWVVATDVEPRDGLKPIAAVSGDLPVFDSSLLGVLRWAAMHYVAPLSTLLARSAPPNLPRRRDFGAWPDSGPGPAGTGLEAVVSAAVGGGRATTHYWLGPGPWGDAIASLVSPVAAVGHSTLVVGPTWAEVEEMATTLRRSVGDRVVVASSHLDAATVTRAWVEASMRPGAVVVGTREIALWPMPGLALAVVVGEGRVGMKDKATPTLHARELLLLRSAVERFSLVLCGLVPSPEALGKAATVVPATSGRPWGHVEVVDRRGRAGLLADATAAAVRSAGRDGKRVFVFSDRRLAAQRCVRCRALRACPSCGASPGDGRRCSRCGAPTAPCQECGARRFESLGAPVGRVITELGRIVGDLAVGEAGAGRAFQVGTERDIPEPGSVDLGLVIDADGLLMAPRLRAAEHGLRVLARVVAAASPGRGRRGLVQTADPEHRVLAALREADPVGFIRSESRRRAAEGLPPGREALVVEATRPPEGADAKLREVVGRRGDVQGPMAVEGGRQRWLLLAEDLSRARVALRPLVAAWREEGARVRVDADPLEL